MERPVFDEEVIIRQNRLYATDVIEKFRELPKTADVCMTAITEAFIMGAGGYDGSFDAAIVLEYGGFDVLLESLGVANMDINPAGMISEQSFEDIIHASVDFGAAYDDLEREIAHDAISDGAITGELFGPLASRFNINDPTPWRTELE